MADAELLDILNLIEQIKTKHFVSPVYFSFRFFHINTPYELQLSYISLYILYYFDDKLLPCCSKTDRLL